MYHNVSVYDDAGDTNGMPAKDYYLPKRQLVSQNDSSIIESARVPRSKFTNAWTRKTTFDAGYLIPILIDEVLPGDHLSYRVTAYVRMATPLFPMFDNQRIDTFFFFVPNRLLWTNWVKFMGEQTNPGDSIAYTVPIMPSGGGYATGSLQDHMGLPTSMAGFVIAGYNHNTLPLRAYNLIYNQWFRDQNLINSAVVDVDDGPDAPGDYVLRRRAKSHDYFTSALPWPQKFTAPTINIGALAPIVGFGSFDSTGLAGPVNAFETDVALSTSYAAYKPTADAVPTNAGLFRMTGTTGDDRPSIYANLAAVTGITINQLRQAWLVQTLLERDARGGTRYTEIILAHFDVRSPDARLQRAEYIGGGQTPLQITPIAQTAPTAGATVGVLGATGTAAGQHSASYAATEHGYIIGLINVKSELSYQQGLHKMYSRSTRFDFYFPALAGLGEQAILRKELVLIGTAQDEQVFGYQERWHEYRTRQSEVVGTFKSTQAGTYDAWHLAQIIASPLSSTKHSLRTLPQ